MGINAIEEINQRLDKIEKTLEGVTKIINEQKKFIDLQIKYNEDNDKQINLLYGYIESVGNDLLFLWRQK